MPYLAMNFKRLVENERKNLEGIWKAEEYLVLLVDTFFLCFKKKLKISFEVMHIVLILERRAYQQT